MLMNAKLSRTPPPAVPTLRSGHIRAMWKRQNENGRKNKKNTEQEKKTKQERKNETK